MLAIALAFGFAAGGLTGWGITSTYKDAKHLTQLAKAKEVADKAFNAQVALVKAKRIEGEALTEKLERQNVENAKRGDAAAAVNRRLERELGGLRDPYSSGRCAVPSGASDSSDALGATDGHRLSPEASQFLLDFATDAAKVSEYAWACYPWAKSRAEARAAQLLLP